MIPLRKIQAGQYATLDGRYLIEQHPYERECDCSSCRGDGSFCRGGGWAVDWFWNIWDVETDEYLEGTHFSSFDTLLEAREHLTPPAALAGVPADEPAAAPAVVREEEK